MNDHRAARKILTADQGLVLDHNDIFFIVRKKYEKMMRIVVDLCTCISLNEDVIVGCVNNGWKKIVRDLCDRKEFASVNLTNSDAIIMILSFGDIKLSTRILNNPALDFNDVHRKVLDHILMKDRVNLLRVIVKRVKIDEDIIIFIVARDSKEIAKFIRSPESSFTMTLELKKIIHIRTVTGQPNKASIILMKE